MADIILRYRQKHLHALCKPHVLRLFPHHVRSLYRIFHHVIIRPDKIPDNRIPVYGKGGQQKGCSHAHPVLSSGTVPEHRTVVCLQKDIEKAAVIRRRMFIHDEILIQLIHIELRIPAQGRGVFQHSD